ncbi:MAG: hypothetical protein SV375_19595 [Thermodesulfobacteriota bacterium]|nr:hypothetical protein [Thermodesulfobacteriota bacterium]
MMGRSAGAYKKMLIIDGQVGLHITYQDSITIKKAPHTIHMIRPPDLSYYDVLKAKLRWGGR